MKIKVCKSKWLTDVIYKADREFHNNNDDYWYPQKTYLSDYSPHFEDEDVTIDQLHEYISKGYAIKINC